MVATAPWSARRLIPSTSSRRISLPLLNNVLWVDASPATLASMSPLLLSDALISTRCQPRSRAKASVTEVLLTPAGPWSSTAALLGLPLLHDSTESRSFSMADLFPVTSLLVLGLYFVVQGSTDMANVSKLCVRRECR